MCEITKLKNTITNTSIEVQDGTFLKDCKGEEGLPSFGCCRGLCGLCLIELTEGFDNLPPLTEQESTTLKAIKKSTDRHRLACQVKVSGPFSFAPVFS